MSITAIVENGLILLPPGAGLPDGTQVEIVIRGESRRNTQQPVSLPTFNGDGLQPGVKLNDSHGMRQLLDQDSKVSQLI